MTIGAKGVVVTVLCTEPDDQRFCRRISAIVNPSQVYLSRVMVMGRQVYPAHDAVLGNSDRLLRCEFWIRDASPSISDAHVHDLLQRLENYEVVEAYTFNGGGSTLERVRVPMSVGS